MGAQSLPGSVSLYFVASNQTIHHGRVRPTDRGQGEGRPGDSSWNPQRQRRVEGGEGEGRCDHQKQEKRRGEKSLDLRSGHASACKQALGEASGHRQHRILEYNPHREQGLETYRRCETLLSDDCGGGGWSCFYSRLCLRLQE